MGLIKGMLPLFILASLIPFGALQKTGCGANLADMVFLVDSSSSIGDPSNYMKLKQFLHTFISGLDVGPNKVKVGMVQFNNDTQEEFLLGDYGNKNELLEKVDNLRYLGGQSEIGQALQFILSKNSTKDGGSLVRQNVPQIAVVITNYNDDVVPKIEDIKAAAEKLREKGFLIFTIGVGAEEFTELQYIANRPLHRFILPYSDYQELLKEADKVLDLLCIVMQQQQEALVPKFADVFVLVDSSIKQIGQVKQLLLSLVEQLNVGSVSNRMALAQFGENVTVEFNFNEYTTKKEVLTFINNFRLKGTGKRKLGKALNFLQDYLLSTESGSRIAQGYKQYLLVVDTRVSDDTVNRAAEELNNEKVTIINIDISKDQTPTQFPASPRLFGPGQSYLQETVISTSENTLLASAKNVKQLAQDVKTVVTSKRQHDEGDCKLASAADIVFIVDVSDSNSAPVLRDFLYNVIDGLQIAPGGVQVGMVLYSTTPKAEFYLNDFDKKPEVLNYIKLLTFEGGTSNTAKALKFAREEVFTRDRGSRKDLDVQQIAVVIVQNEKMNDFKNDAEQLRLSGVQVYALGTNETQLKEIASCPSKQFTFVVNFNRLHTWDDILRNTLCHGLVRSNVVKATGHKVKQGCRKTDETDIYFLIDGSSSITEKNHMNFEYVKSFILEFLRIFPIGPEQVRAGVVQYSTGYTLEFGLTEHKDKTSLENAVKNIKHLTGNTYTGKALRFISERFKDPKEQRGNVSKVLIVLTDGKAHDDVKEPAAEIRNQGISVYAVGVADANNTELLEIAQDKNKKFYVDEFIKLKDIKNDLATEFCSNEACKNSLTDVFFLVDGSESIEQENFQKIKDFLIKMVSKLQIKEDGAHVGVIQYSSHPQIEFELGKFVDEQQIQQAINAIEQLKDGTMTGAALNYVSQYYNETHGARPNSSKVLIVITDGDSKDDVVQPSSALRQKGVIIYSIGIGIRNATQLRHMSGTLTNYFLERDFEALKSLDEKILLGVCTADKDCQKLQVADILFLVDGSTSIHVDDFKKVKSFMISLVNSTQVGPDYVRFCTILFATSSHIQFTLDQYKNKKEVQDAIENLKQPTGNTETAAALHYSIKYFDKSSGGRREKGVPQILLLITDGEATVPGDLPKAAEAIHQQNVTVYGIGVGKANKDELNTITKDSSKVFHVKDFKALETVRKKISNALCNESKPECQNKDADLVILFEGSKNIDDSGWNSIIYFMQNVVDNLRIKEDLYQVGVAQFSSDYQEEFYLKHDETDVKNKINAITRINDKSTAVNMGHALKRVQEFYESSKGSRFGVPRKLLLITATKPTDDVFKAVNRLRAMKIELHIVGIGYTAPNYITRTSERIFMVGSFNELKKELTTQQVITSLCNTPSGIKSSCTIDIGIGFDISLAGQSSQLSFSSQIKLQNYLPEIVKTIATVPKICCVTDPKLQTSLGFHIVARDGGILYDTQFERYNENIVKKVLAQQRPQAVAFNTQLLKSLQDKMAKSNAGVKVVIVFTDGVDAPYADLKLASQELRNTGVHALLIVALDRVLSTTALQELEFGRGFDFQHPLIIDMSNVAITIQSQIENVASRECCDVICKCAGHEGARGFRGIKGEKGTQGRQGYPGFPGHEGGVGGRGPPGMNGTQGHRGCFGKRGIKGGRGYRGDLGEEGEHGFDGVFGEQGETGLAGSAGERGDPGSPGKKGIAGTPGGPGNKGLRGDPGQPGTDNIIRGPKGEAGYAGMQGDVGPDGTQGSSGDSGKAGPDGRRGTMGSPGSAGAQGTPGPPGISGASGSLGKIGPNGASGQKGLPGLTGRQGSPGDQGSPGTKGLFGITGPKGQIGDPGIKGIEGPLGPRGPPGIDGPDGFGLPGSKGHKGDPGFPGHPGVEGEYGNPGTDGQKGSKGTRGRGGDAGRQGEPGSAGNNGPPGHRGAKGPPGTLGMNQCQLISYVRDNCVCCKDKAACPVYPTDLVIGMDMSADMDNSKFERMRSVVLSLLEDLNIAESNCPTGARVAVVSYSTNTNYLIRFSDHLYKRKLVEAINNIALERTSHRRNIGAAMRFVGRNVFKRVRQGVLMRKVAIFLSGGESQDETAMTTAILEYKAQDISLGVLTFSSTPTPKVQRAFQADEAKNFILSLVKPQEQERELERIKQCVICFDYCNPGSCSTGIKPVPQEADLDLAFLVDGSRSILGDQYEGVKHVLSTVLDQLEIRRHNSGSDRPARVALYQQSSTYSEAQAPVKQIFNLQQFHDRGLMKQSIFQNLTQTSGKSNLGLALEFVVLEQLLVAQKPRKNKMVLVIAGEETDYYDKEKLDFISNKAKCEGVVLFILTVGDHFSSAEVEELASSPIDQHIVHLGHVKHGDQEYARRFLRTFLHILNGGINTYPPPQLKEQCTQTSRQTARRAPIESIPLHTLLHTETADAGVEEKLERTEYSKKKNTLETTRYEHHGQSHALCLPRMDIGTFCGKRRYELRWYYNSTIGACSTFWYRGCKGNTNRFSTEGECIKKCVTNRDVELRNVQKDAPISEDICNLKNEPGTCSNYVLKWYYNKERGACFNFWYGGCNGNQNRFNSLEECKARCVRLRTV